MLGWIIFIIFVVVVGPLFYFSMKRAMKQPDTRKPGEWGDVSGSDSSDWGGSN